MPSPLDTVESRKIRYAQELAAYSFRQFQAACQEAEVCRRDREFHPLESSPNPATSLGHPPSHIQSHRDPNAYSDTDAPRNPHPEYATVGSGSRVTISSPPSDPTTPKERKPSAEIYKVDYGASVDGPRGTNREDNR